MAHYQTEEQQLEAIRDFFKQNQRLILILLVGLLSVFGLYRYWQWHHLKHQSEASQIYDAMMQASAQHDEKKTQAYVNRITESYPRTIYAQASTLMQAKLLLQAGDTDKAISALHGIVRSASFPAVKQLARIRLARVFISTGRSKDALDLLSTTDDNSYASWVWALKADCYSALGEKENALEAYQKAQALASEAGMADEFLEVKVDKN